MSAPAQMLLASAASNPLVMLLNFNGTNGDTTFTDSGPYAFTFTANGNAQLSTTSPKFGSACLLLDGTGDFASTTDAAGLELGSSDFTVEFWMNPTANSGTRTLFGKRGDNTGQGFVLVRNNGTTPEVFLSSTGTSWDTSISSSTTISTATWYHVAVVRLGSTVTLYLDGANVGSTTFSGALNNNSSSVRIGGDSNGSQFNGKMDCLRVKREAVYTAAFTPPSSELTP